ncbi:hypothetical protein [Brevibacillus brevis]|uniref:Uncharacterized protein n=1 Tax=Brevibacillus brevis TaxID=1393 RepID=A0ABY9T9N6_BREBE|nr:hypothetical protein [Brevibacillus brevis]WNC16594.1 hypothetical protein RGB73_09825 [Brevibacillus brevis]
MTFLLISVLLFNTIAWILPKKLTRLEMYTTSLFAFALTIVTDVYLDLKHGFYGYFKVGADYEALIVFIGLYPSFSIIFLNLFPYDQGMAKKTIYLVCTWLFCLLYEKATLTPIGFFYYNGWKLWYSAILYPILLGVLCLHLFLLRKWVSTAQK